jgi:hypothetical protein
MEDDEDGVVPTFYQKAFRIYDPNTNSNTALPEDVEETGRLTIGLIEAIEADASSQLRSKVFKHAEPLDVGFDHLFVLAVIRNEYEAICRVLHDHENAKDSLNLLFLSAYRAGALGLGSNIAKEHPFSQVKTTNRVKGKNGGVISGETRKAKAAAREEQEEKQIRGEIEAHPSYSNRRIADLLIERGYSETGYEALRKAVASVRRKLAAGRE